MAMPTPTSRPAAVLCCCYFFVVVFLLLPAASRAFPLCTDQRAPLPLNGTLAFCGYAGASCCDAAVDAALRKQFDAASVSDAPCAAVLKSVLCARCNPYSAELFDAGPNVRTVPFLCNSTSSATSAQSKETTQDYCKLVWETCKDVTILNSPFQPPLQGGARLPSSPSKLTDAWQSESDFCTSFGGVPSDRSVCFGGGNTVSFDTAETSASPKGVCLERLDNGSYSYLNMVPHPDGSNRVFLGTQAGKIWLATVPEQGSGGTLQFGETGPFVDLTDQDQYEEVDLISKGGNYGWRVYEGPLVYDPPWTPGGNTSLKFINSIPPIMGYNHSDVNKNIGSASIIGGSVYRGSADPCLYGRYLYADLYASAMWTGTETPESSGNYTSNLISFSCSKDSPIPCDSAAGSPLPSLGYIYSFGEDNSKDIYVLASKGVYRVVRPSLCRYTCPTEKPETNNGKAPAGPSSNAPTTGVGMQMRALLLFVIMSLVLIR
uniref:Uncharacterized protein n=1 Tax=Avena sativa TaxID=4498 RepID=A0ACD5WA58_AVESA